MRHSERIKSVRPARAFSSPVDSGGVPQDSSARIAARVLCIVRYSASSLSRTAYWTRAAVVSTPSTCMISYLSDSAVRGEIFRIDATSFMRSEEHTSELQSPCNLVCRLLLEKKKKQ